MAVEPSLILVKRKIPEVGAFWVRLIFSPLARKLRQPIRNHRANREIRQAEPDGRAVRSAAVFRKPIGYRHESHKKAYPLMGFRQSCCQNCPAPAMPPALVWP